MTKPNALQIHQVAMMLAALSSIACRADVPRTRRDRDKTTREKQAVNRKQRDKRKGKR